MASEPERAALADGILTFDEYERAVLASISCIQDAGFNIVSTPPTKSPTLPVWVYDVSKSQPGYRLTPRGRILYAATGGAYEPAQAALIVQRCKQDHSDSVEFLWTEHTAPTEADYQALRVAVSSCLRDRGIEAPVRPSAEDLLRIAYPPNGEAEGRVPPDWYAACETQAGAEFPVE